MLGQRSVRLLRRYPQTGLATGSIWFCQRSVDATNNMSAESLRSGLIYLASVIKLPGYSRAIIIDQPPSFHGLDERQCDACRCESNSVIFPEPIATIKGFLQSLR